MKTYRFVFRSAPRTVCLAALAYACIAPVSAPPSTPQPISTFAVKFIPANEKRYPPTQVSEVYRFKNVLHWPGTPDEVNGDERPTRQYLVIGKLYFEKAWYSSAVIQTLIEKHVPAVGGHAVLTYEAFQTQSAMMFNPPTQYYYQSLVLEVIRYTDEPQ